MCLETLHSPKCVWFQWTTAALWMALEPSLRASHHMLSLLLHFWQRWGWLSSLHGWGAGALHSLVVHGWAGSAAAGCLVTHQQSGGHPEAATSPLIAIHGSFCALKKTAGDLVDWKLFWRIVIEIICSFTVLKVASNEQGHAILHSGQQCYGCGVAEAC